MAITAFLSHSPDLLKWGPGGPASLGQVLIPASSLQLSRISCAPSYIIVLCPLNSTCRQSRLSPWYLRPDAPVIYTGTFPILTARPGSIGNICSFSSSFFTWNVHMGRVRESWRWLKCTHTGTTVWFLCETSLPFCFVLLGSKSSLVYIIFWTPTQSLWSHLPHPPTHWMQTCLLSTMSPTQLTWLLCWGNTCIPFTLENRCTSCCFTTFRVQLF